MIENTDTLDDFLRWLKLEKITFCSTFYSEKLESPENILFYSYEESQELVEDFLDYSRTHHDG